MESNADTFDGTIRVRGSHSWIVTFTTPIENVLHTDWLNPEGALCTVTGLIITGKATTSRSTTVRLRGTVNGTGIGVDVVTDDLQVHAAVFDAIAELSAGSATHRAWIETANA